MFSTAQQEYIDSVIPTYAKQGYRYYIVQTNSNIDSSYYSNPDLIFYFSKKSIAASSGYSFSFSGDVIVVKVRTGNYSSYSGANNSSRVSVSSYDTRTVRIELYEHVYTNAQFEGIALQPDFNLISGGETNVRLEAIGFILLTFCLLAMLGRVLRFWH